MSRKGWCCYDTVIMDSGGTVRSSASCFGTIWECIGDGLDFTLYVRFAGGEVDRHVAEDKEYRTDSPEHRANAEQSGAGLNKSSREASVC